jgi:hypothetical protein
VLRRVSFVLKYGIKSGDQSSTISNYLNGRNRHTESSGISITRSIIVSGRADHYVPDGYGGFVKAGMAYVTYVGCE